MGRPAVTAQRTDEILDAFEICVARYGVDGATLEKTAEEAGLARALIRHHVGNKDELLELFLQRFWQESKQQSDQFFSALPTTNRAAAMVEWLFDPAYADAARASVYSALIIAANVRPTLARRLRRWIDDFVAQINEVLREEFPESTDESTSAAALAISAMYFNVDSLAPLGRLIDVRESSLRAAKILLTNLSTECA